MLKNYYELIDELADLLVDFEAHPRACEVDVYLYIDEDDDGNFVGRLAELGNPGGSSWIPDEHFCIHSDRCEHDAFAYCDDEESIAYALGISLDELMERVREFLVERDGYEAEGRIGWCDVQDYVRETPGLYQQLCEGVAQFASVQDTCREYAEVELHDFMSYGD